MVSPILREGSSEAELPGSISRITHFLIPLSSTVCVCVWVYVPHARVFVVWKRRRARTVRVWNVNQSIISVAETPFLDSVDIFASAHTRFVSLCVCFSPSLFPSLFLSLSTYLYLSLYIHNSLALSLSLSLLSHSLALSICTDIVKNRGERESEDLVKDDPNTLANWSSNACTCMRVW